jgi:pimeloyl-ACP methyl ester carboxylesterase
MYLNAFAAGIEPLDMTKTGEFDQLLLSAQDVGLHTPAAVRYVSRNVVANGLRLHVLEWGEEGQPPLLLLHGGSLSAHSWDLVSLVLSERFHVVALDQRGHGDSEWPRDGDRTRWPMAADAYEVTRFLGLAKPIVFGHSMGGLVAMTLLQEHPGVAKKVVLVDVGPTPTREWLEGVMRTDRKVPEFDSLDEFVARVAAANPSRPAGHSGRTARYNLMQRADGKFVSKHDSRRWGDTPNVAVEWARSFEDSVRIESLSGCPALLVRGESSTILEPDAAARFVGCLPEARLVTVPACGHNVHMQNPSGFLAAVRPFLEE